MYICAVLLCKYKFTSDYTPHTLYPSRLKEKEKKIRYFRVKMYILRWFSISQRGGMSELFLAFSQESRVWSPDENNPVFTLTAKCSTGTVYWQESGDTIHITI